MNIVKNHFIAFRLRNHAVWISVLPLLFLTVLSCNETAYRAGADALRDQLLVKEGPEGVKASV